MRSAVLGRLLALLMVLAALAWGALPAMPQGGSENRKSHTGKDYVQIDKITPRTAADLPVPTVLPFTMEISYTLQSAPKGKLRVGLFRWRPGASTRRTADGGLGPGLEQLIPPIEKDIVQGKGVQKIATDPVILKAAANIDSQVIAVVNLHDPSKKELCWAASYNHLRGRLDVQTETGTPSSDGISVLSFNPKVGNLKVGHSHAFRVMVQYSLKSKPWGFVNLELGERAALDQGAPWYVAVVPVKQGKGLLTITTKDIFMPAQFASRQMEMALPFRLDPLGGTKEMPRYGPWTLVRASTGG